HHDTDDNRTAVETARLHATFQHPGYEYRTTTGPRKQWADADRPPLDDEGEPEPGWERNIDAGLPGMGWERFDYTEESYWRRPKEDTCRTVQVGGTVVRVHGAGEMSDEARDALGALVDVARRMHEEDHPPVEAPDPERRERYAEALYNTVREPVKKSPWHTLSAFWRAAWYDRADAAMALADAEHAELTQQPEAPQPDCLFCRRDDPENEVIAENGRFYARWDNYPAALGHAEIVPKDHAVSLFELTPDDVGELFELLLEVRSILDVEHHPDGYTIGVNEGRAAGRTIDHLHLHLIPRYDGDVPDPRGGIRHVLPGTDADQWSKQPGAPASTPAEAVLREHLRYVLDYSGPPHEHEVPGQWDADGSPCDHCARLAAARAALED
uniref:HIT family protein n=1 Tax=Streptomyces capuensis TaxID=1464056 RepID=UPI0007C48C8C